MAARTVLWPIRRISSLVVAPASAASKRQAAPQANPQVSDLGVRLPVHRCRADATCGRRRWHATWRIKVGVHLAGKPFDSVQLDVSPRQHELDVADRIELLNLLAFARGAGARRRGC